MFLLGFNSAAFSGQLAFSVSNVSVNENASKITVSVVRTGDATAPASVTVVSADGTALAPADYSTVSSTLNWAGGEANPISLDVTINDNGVVNDTKSFTLSLTNATGDINGAVSTLTISILDYEEGILQFGASSYASPENSGIANVAIRRTSGSDGIVSIKITSTNGTAVGGSDFSPVTAKTVILADGEATKIVGVTLVNDDDGEATEQFTIEMSEATGGASVGEQATTSVSITDNDMDFTKNTAKLTPALDKVTQPQLIDLGSSTLLDPTKTYLELMNNIPILRESGISATQNPEGLIEFVLGQDKFYLRPVAVYKSESSATSTIMVDNFGTVKFYTESGLVIECQESLASLSSFQMELAKFDIPKITLTEDGVMIIKADQGTPKFERKPDGKLVLANSFYDHWVFRPKMAVTESESTIQSLQPLPHPTIANEVILGFFFSDSSGPKVQYLTPNPYKDQELSLALRQKIGTLSVSLKDLGIVEFDAVSSYSGGVIEKVRVSLFSDYKITKVEDFTINQAGFFEHSDIDNDGVLDYVMIYTDGYQQIFRTIESKIKEN